jgi:protein FrlC
MEKPGMNRRQFVGATLAATAGALSPAVFGGSAGRAQGKPAGIKVGLYSITYLGVWYRGPALTHEELLKRAKKYGYDGIEIDGKRPHGNPLDMPTSRCKEIRSMADGEGIEIFGVAGNNDFSSPITEHRECQLLYVRELIRVASDLRAKVVRVFLGWPGVTQQPQLASYDVPRTLWRTAHRGVPPEQTWARCRDGLIECAHYAGDAGVTLALQNHKPIIEKYTDVLRMVKEVGSPHLNVSLDAPLLTVKTPEYIRKAALDAGSVQVLSHFGGEYKRGPDGKVHGESFYAPFISAMKEIGYEGYMSYELCHPLPKVNGQTVGIEYADQCAELAQEFMRGLIQTVPA